jgi:hypothetical protein
LNLALASVQLEFVLTDGFLISSVSVSCVGSPIARNEQPDQSAGGKHILHIAAGSGNPAGRI